MKKIFLLPIILLVLGAGCAAQTPSSADSTQGTQSPVSTLPAATTTPETPTAVDRYLSNNPKACETMKFACKPGEHYFINSGGCGCAMDTNSPPPAQPPTTDDASVCYNLYQPVCGEKTVYCIKAPCPPIKQTYSNDCFAKKDGAKNITEGVCPEK